VDWLKPVPHRLKPAPLVIAGLNTGYSRSTRVSYVLALKPPMLSISLVTKLPLARGCLYIWPPLPRDRIETRIKIKHGFMPFPLGNLLLDLKSRVNHHPSLFGVSSIWGILPCSGSLAYFCV
jgi:hypothetical protein